MDRKVFYSYLLDLKYETWVDLSKSKNKDLVIKLIKELIDTGEPFEFNQDYTKFRKIDIYFSKFIYKRNIKPDKTTLKNINTV